MGGPITGRGFHLGIVDDPIHPQNSFSAVYRRRFRSWWTDVWMSRQNALSAADGRAQIVVVMQRLSPEDPIDFLLKLEVGEGAEGGIARPERWHVVAMDEIRSSAPFGPWSGPGGFPPTCTLEPDERREGEPLAPSLLSYDAVLESQKSAGPLAAAAQRQQRPMAVTGAFWKLEWFEVYDELPQHAYDGGKDWDTSYGANDDAAASAYVETYRGPGSDETFPIYVHDVGWGVKPFPDLVEWMRKMPGPHYVEDKATGKSAVQVLTRYGIVAKSVAVVGDKLARASAVQPVVANRRVFVRRAIADRLLYGEGQGLLRISAERLIAGGGGLDVNDAFVQALHRHLRLGGGREYVVRVAR
jgi:phage terminase large subunit-like protein